ncbi:hypothetical protein [Williamsia sp. 1135]|uniref:hypothetical protein n=1 Tax=Williamsia sp. 1135 TaxID=1889262 RepID=UPI000A100BAF|nr:hypothetical protein [Williamsia sp. 1135]ORM27806.1 hypothetical protein BFL43_22195 [Williamsia sp. 1135]
MNSAKFEQRSGDRRSPDDWWDSLPWWNVDDELRGQRSQVIQDMYTAVLEPSWSGAPGAAPSCVQVSVELEDSDDCPDAAFTRRQRCVD